MNNTPTLRWLISICTMLAFSAITNQAVAQCTISSPPEPIQLQLILNPLTGEADLLRATVSPYITGSGAPGCNTTANIRFFYNAAKTLPTTAGLTSITYGCGEANGIESVYVAVASDPADPATFSEAVEFQIAILDYTGPDALTGVSVSVPTDPGACTANSIGFIDMIPVPKTNPLALNPREFTDNCIANLEVGYVLTGATILPYTVGSDAGVEAFNTGITTVTYIITDLQYAGPPGPGSTSVNFTVTVTDMENPTITCPADKNVSTDPGVCQYTYVGLGATGTDNCVGTMIENDVNNTNSLVGEIFPDGTTAVTWTITDAEGNVATCMQNINVSDNENPVFTYCPADITVSADPFTCDYTIGALIPGEFDATASDNCGVNTLINDVTGTNVLDGSFLPIGLSTITWTAADNAGNFENCVFSVTVIDDTAPSVMASDNTVTVSVNSSSCDKVITWTRPSIGAPFDCGSVTMSETFVSGPDNTVLNGLPAFNPLTGGGNVATNFPAGTTVIRYSWIDDSPNSPDFSVLYTFTVLEDIIPTAKCKDVTVQLNSNGIATLNATQADNGSFDNCPLGLTVTVSAPNGSPASGSSIQFDCNDLVMQPMNGWPFTLTALDANSNTNTANCFVTILDNQKPLVTCPANITVNANASCTATIGASGNMTLGTFPNAGQYDDNCTVTQIVVTANNGADLDNMTALAQSTLTINGNDPTVSLSGAVFQKGTTNVVYTIKDQASNSEACSFNIIVNDNTDPSTTSTLCNSTIVKNINTISCAYIPAPGDPIWVNPTWTENCGTFTVVTTGGTPTSPFPQGSTNITITATDQSGNVGTCSFVVKVQDFVAPDAKCNNLTVNLNGPTTITALQVNNNSTDNCTFPANLTYALFELNGTTPLVQPFTCSNVPSKKVVLKVTDFDGNPDTCQATIKVIDDIAPICNAQPVTVALNASGMATLTATALNNGSSDNCSGLNVIKEVSKSASGPWTSSVTYDCTDRTSGLNPAKTAYLRITDASTPSNATVCNNLITIIDNIPPVGNGPDDITLECSAVTAYLAQPAVITAVENCTYTVSGPTQSTTPLTNPTCANHYKITRTWVVTDAAGLTDLVQQVITVEDNTEPDVNITSFTPGIEEVVPNEEYKIYLSDYEALPFPFDACYPVVTFNFASTDNCSVISEDWTVSYADDGYGPYADQTGTGSVIQSPFVTGENYITFNLTDACGNATQLVVLVTVVDDVAPKFGSYLLPAPNPTSISYCDHQFVFPNSPGTCGYTFQWNRPWYGDIDECNNAGSDLVFAPESIVANGIQNISANYPWDPSNGLTELIPVSVTLPVGTTVFTYTVTDQAANAATCSFTVKVNDTQSPVLTGIQTAMLNTICPTQQIPDYTGLVNVIDNCPSSVVLTQSPAVGTALSAITTYTTPGPNPADGSQFTVTITATDASGVPTTRNITVTLDDNTAPIPNQSSLSDQMSNCGFIILSAPTAKPNCINGPTIYGTPGGVNATPETVNGSIITSYRVTLFGTTCQTYFVTWSYNDGNGNVSTQLQKVTICPDVAPPIAICKAGVTNIILAPSSATLAPATVDGDNGTYSINGSHDPDMCSAVPTTSKVTLSLSQSVYTCADLNKTTVTLTATDNGGNTATCTAQIKVIDNIAPVISTINLPANDTIEVCLDTVPGVPALPSVLDNCSATVSLTEISTKGSTGSGQYNYLITRTWTATDTYGNTSTVSRTILVRDTKKPVFTAPAPASLVFNTDPGDPDCAATTKFNVANYIQDCAPDAELTISSSPAFFNFSDTTEILAVGSHVVTFTATDPSGNTASMSITIVVNDVTKPVASCINGISISLNQNGQAIVTPSLVNNNSYDNCTATPVSLQLQELYQTNGDTVGMPSAQLVFDCENADGDSQYPMILIATDGAGNTAFCETYVVIQDNVKPTITCPVGKTVQCSPNPATAFATTVLGEATATDNCPSGVNTITYTDAPVSNGFSCSSFVRTFQAIDLSGNTATCDQMITVQDTIKPQFTTSPQSDTISCNDPLVIAPILQATDNCTPADSIKITFSELKTDSVGDCGKYQYKVTRTWTATDKCGNTTALTQVLKIEDNLEPVFLGMPDTLVVSSANFPPNGDCLVPVSLNVGQYLSDCQADSSILVTNDAPHGNLGYDISGNYDVGTYVIHFSAIDACGNVGLDSIYLDVVDNSAPTVICNNNVVVSLGSGGVADIETTDIDLGSTDNCGIDTMWLSVSDFDCSQIGVNQVQLIVRDIHGNENQCTVEVEVTIGVNVGFTLTASATAESSFGANDGTATAVATGGSGLFTYKWSNNATTASISNLAAGDYTITVTDIVNGCISTATVTVDEGAKISLTAGIATGCQNTSVTIPVTIDNLINSTGFSFTLSLPNLTAGSISGITDINPALTGLIGNPLPGNNYGIFWANGGAPLTLPNSSLLFNVTVQLAAAPLGTSSTVTFSGTPLQLEFSQDSSGFNVIYGIDDIDINTGSVTINCAVSNWEISGLIQTWKSPVKPVPGADVALTGTTVAAVTTPANGSYLFSVPDANNTILTPTKVTVGNDGITAADLLFISNHIFNNLLPSPYQWVAADANGDGNITLNDYLRIQKVALGTDQHIQGAPDWKFVPKSYVFPTPNPLSQTVPQTVSFTATNDSIVDFVAIRMGDVNGNITPSLTNDQTDSRTNGTFRFQLDDRSFRSGDVIEVPFRASDFSNRQAYQMTINFDPAVFQLTDIKMGALPKLNDDNFGTAYLADGHLTTLWVNRDPITIADGEVLFTLTFRAARNGASLAEVLRAGSEITRAEAYDLDGNVMKVDFDFARSADPAQALQPFALYQNQPNPFNTGTTIGFRLPESGRASLRVYNMSGRLVKTVIGNFEKGYNELQLRNSDLGEAGVYWYELETATHSDRKKMILID